MVVQSGQVPATATEPDPQQDTAAPVLAPGPRPDSPSVGLVVPYDFALDRELWRWCPPQADLHVTRTPHLPLEVGLAQARAVGAPGALAQAVHDLSTVRPGALAYCCTSGSFVGGLAGELALRETMLEAGGPRAVTTSGALLGALAVLQVRRVTVVTPYDEAVTASLSQFLVEAGVAVVSAGHLGLTHAIWTVPEEVTAALVRSTVVATAEAVFVSCTNLRSYPVLAPLETELGIPVLSANQVTLWQALDLLGLAAVGAGQSLLHRSATGSRHTPSTEVLT